MGQRTLESYIGMRHLRSLLANANRMLSEPIIPLWPVELLRVVDAMVFSMPEGAAAPALPPTPFRKLQVVFDVMGQGAQDIQFWDGDCMLLSIRRKANGGRLGASAKGLYVAWRSRVAGDRRRLLEQCAAMCGVELEIGRRQGGEVTVLLHRHEESGRKTWEAWPPQKGLVIARMGHGTRVIFVDPVSREY